MGTTTSGGNLTGTPPLTIDAQASLNQILCAFHADIPRFVHLFRLGTKDEHHGIKAVESTRFETSSSTHVRSRSADHFFPEDEVKSRGARLVVSQLSSNKRQWQCQLCRTKNDSDAHLCSQCGANKINVYIPILSNSLDHQRPRKRGHQHSDSSTSAPMNVLISQPTGDEEELTHRRSVLIAHKREADEHLVFDYVNKLLGACRQSHHRFKDEHFPASSRSLFINGQHFSKSTLALLPDQQPALTASSSAPTERRQKIYWLRPDQIRPEDWPENSRTDWTVFRDPRPNDVLQGALGDCWFITALSVLAEESEYLMRILITKQYNREGIYCVRLCKDGEWTQVFIDDRLPCTSEKRLAYSQAHRKQLWVPLIEKALAKLHGSYEAIIAGRCCEGLATVTGSPCETLILGRSNNPDDKNIDHERLWAKLHNARTKRFLMCAMCSNNLIRKEEFNQVGLLNIHAYSLQDIRQSKDGKHRLVKLRNPWGGTHRWKGDWSDGSRLWAENTDLRRELLNERDNRRDGVFWMPFHSFVKYFECVDICKLRSNWYEVRDTGNFYPTPKFIQAYQLILSTTTELDLTLHRKISKNLRIQRSEVSLCLAVINLEEQSDGSHRIYAMPIVSQRGQHKFISTDGQLPAGTYWILPLLFNPVEKYLDNTDFNLAIHSSHQIDLERVKLPSRIEREFLIKFCIFYGDQVRPSDVSDGVTIYELKKYWDGLIVLVENRHRTKNVHFHFRCLISDNALISRPDAQRDLYDIIPPNHRQIIVTVSRKSASQSFTIGHDLEYTLSSQTSLDLGEQRRHEHWPKIDQSPGSDDIHRPQKISAALSA